MLMNSVENNQLSVERNQLACDFVLMSKTQLIMSKVDKAIFYKLKPQNKNVFDQIKTKKNTKQQLRDIILDYIIQKLYKENHKSRSHKALHNSNFKRIPISIEAQVNGVKRKIEANGYYVLQKYIEFEKNNMYRQNNIEPLVVEILNFFDQMQEIADNINFEMTEENGDLPTMIINILLDKYNKNRQKINRIKELDIVKSKTIAKYTRVSYIDIENNLEKKQCQIYVEKSHQSSHRVSRDTINSITEKESTEPKEIKNSKSKLKDLVDTYKVFQHPDKVEKLRAEKLKEIYDHTQIQKTTDKIRIQHSNFSTQSKSKDPNHDYLKFLQNWIADISISQKLFKQKMDQKESKLKQNQIHVAKIIQESEDQDSEDPKSKIDPKPSLK